MVRALTLTKPHPDAGRIAAISASIVANIALFMFLMQPPQATTQSESQPETTVTIVDPAKPHPLPDPPKPVRVEPDHHVDTTVHPLLKNLAQPPIPVVGPANPMSFKPDNAVVEVPVVDPPLPPAAPVESSLNPIESPAPVYPRVELANEISGTVELELLVDVDGHVLKVTILHSSGNRNLDAAAREQVLRHWRFEPATSNGVPVQAIGRVPIVFTLNQ